MIELKLILVILISIDQAMNMPLNETAYIIGGWTTSGPYPYMVELRDANGGHHCGGSILNENWIITAGHCAGK